MFDFIRVGDVGIAVDIVIVVAVIVVVDILVAAARTAFVGEGDAVVVGMPAVLCHPADPTTVREEQEWHRREEHGDKACETRRPPDSEGVVHVHREQWKN